MKTKAFAYLRVSSEQQAKDEKDGFPRQEKVIKEYAAANNLEIVQIYREPWTGKEENRPQLDEMMVSLQLNGHGIRTVIIERLDRLARSVMTQEIIVADIHTGGYELISAKEGKDLQSDDLDRTLFRQMMGAFNEYDRKKIVNRLRLGRERKKRLTGKGSGRKSYHEENPEIIAYIRQLRRKPKYRKQMTYKQIADRLNDEGYKTLDGKAWTLHRVNQVMNCTTVNKML